MRTASPATFTHDKATAHTQMRTTQRKLPFTYRTFGVSGAQPQSHYSQHAGYSQHLLGRDSAPGRRRDYTVSSFFFSPLSFFFFPLSFSFPPSPSNSTPRVLSSSLRAECGNSSLICGTRQAAWSRRRTPGCPRSTSPHRNCTRRTAGRVDGRGSN